jgi:uncharacterized membrane protein
MPAKWDMFRPALYGGLIGLLLGIMHAGLFFAEGSYKAVLVVLCYVGAAISFTVIAVAIRNAVIRWNSLAD